MAILELEAKPVTAETEPHNGRMLHGPVAGSVRAPRGRLVGVLHLQPEGELLVSEHHVPHTPSNPDYLETCMSTPFLKTAKPFNQR